MPDPKIVSRKDFEAKIVASAWRDPKYRQRLLQNPKAVVLEELQTIESGVQLPNELQVAVHEESPTQYHLVLPRNPNEVAPGMVAPDQLEAIAPQTIAVVVVNTVAVTAQTTLNTNANIVQVNSYVTQIIGQVAAQVVA